MLVVVVVVVGGSVVVVVVVVVVWIWLTTVKTNAFESLTVDVVVVVVDVVVELDFSGYPLFGQTRLMV